jgi:hypothetical protein
VPYVAQREALCGGAAAAMVLRYWGDSDVSAEEFAPLVDRAAAGIPTAALAAAIEARGWMALTLRGTKADARAQLGRGRPLVVLLREADGRSHYVVVTGWSQDAVVVQDPARGPLQTLPETAFLEAWQRTGGWTLLVLPGHAASATTQPGRRVAEAHGASEAGCAARVQEAVRLANAGDRTEAGRRLREAAARCPGDAVPLAELAALALLESQFDAAAELAGRAADLDSSNRYAWQLLGTSRYLAGNPDHALRAWNRAGGPRIDRVAIEGADRTPHDLLYASLGLAPGSVLDADGLRRARRRLEAWPTAVAAGVRYVPSGTERADVNMTIHERPRMPSVAPLLRGWGLSALVSRQMTIDTANLVDEGARLGATWRWERGRPQLAVTAAFPRAGSPLGGVLTVDAGWEREDFRATEGVERLRHERMRAGIGLSDWQGADLRWSLGTSLERWRSAGLQMTIEGSLERRLAGDLVAVMSRAAASMPLDGGGSYVQGSIDAAWRSRRDGRKTRLLGRAGIAAIGRAAPPMLWPGADARGANGALLRAHPRIQGGLVTGQVLGPGLVHGGLEARMPLSRRAGLTIELAAFADAARPWGVGWWQHRAQLDVGVGGRFGLPGGREAVRVDLARGARDGGWVLSAGWEAPWPSWR